MNELKPFPLQSLYSSFIPIWKHCSLANSILIHRLPHTSLPISTPNTIHHSHLNVCLPDFDHLPIDFVLVKHLWISWFPRLRFCLRFRNLEFRITIRTFDSPVARHTTHHIPLLSKLGATHTQFAQKLDKCNTPFQASVCIHFLACATVPPIIHRWTIH